MRCHAGFVELRGTTGGGCPYMHSSNLYEFERVSLEVPPAAGT